MNRLFSTALLFLAASPLAFSQIVGPLTFDSAADLTNNFRTLQLPGTGTVSVLSDSTTNGYVNVLAQGTITAWVSIYDTTPETGADTNPTFGGTFTVSFDVSAGNANSSFGIYLFDTSNQNNNLLTLFNINYSGSNDQIRFWHDGVLSTGNPGTQYTIASGAISGTNGTTDSTTNSWITTSANAAAVITDTSDPFTFTNVTITYNPAASTLTLAAGSFTGTVAIPTEDLIANPAIAFRINDSSSDTNSAKIDNFSIIPEPSAMVMMLGGTGLLGILRRRR